MYRGIYVGKKTPEIAGCAVRYVRQCMCPATKYEFGHEGCMQVV